ncbi:MAG: 2-amino-3,7-dideoxy-D-threo-hept-6-ulosonate synthase [Methanobacteriota archaeon]
MTPVGTGLRLRRLLDAKSGNSVMIPLDHGVSAGPIPGIEDPAEAVGLAVAGGATAVVVQKGLVRSVAPRLGHAGLLVHLSASTSMNPADPNDKRIVGTVEEAVSLGADGISVHVNVGSLTESQQLSDLGEVATLCARFGMPLLAMMYPRGPNVRDPHAVEVVRHAARLGAELGADLVKTVYTGSVETFREVVRGCPVPVLVAGGPRADSDRQVLAMVAAAMSAGARGVSLGRNVFQHKDPRAMTRAIADLVLHGADPAKAANALR